MGSICEVLNDLLTYLLPFKPVTVSKYNKCSGQLVNQFTIVFFIIKII